MPFAQADDDDERVLDDGVSSASAGGGDPVDTSRHSGGGYVASGYPTEQQRTFILDGMNSDSTHQRPSDAHK